MTGNPSSPEDSSAYDPHQRACEDGGVWLSRKAIHDLKNEAHAIRLGILLVTKHDLGEAQLAATGAEMAASISRLLAIIEPQQDKV